MHWVPSAMDEMDSHLGIHETSGFGGQRKILQSFREKYKQTGTNKCLGIRKSFRFLVTILKARKWWSITFKFWRWMIFDLESIHNQTVNQVWR